MPIRRQWRKSDSKRRERRERTRIENNEDEVTDLATDEATVRYAGGCFANVGAVNLWQIGNTDKQANISHFKPLIIAIESSNIQTDFDIVFLDTFPDVAADYQASH